MLVSLRWLNQIFPVGTNVDQIIETLTMGGLEVESALDLGMKSGKIVVAKVLEESKHPDADKLHLVKANIGRGEPLSIVCGAPNVRAGMLVPCALPGCVMPDGMEIKRAKIRGQESEGMLCSAKELHLGGGDHSGILELPDTYAIGEPFDCVLDVKVTPNRADCLSLVGIARDLAAMLGKKKTYATTYRFTETLGQTTEQFVNLLIQERNACPRYTCRYIKNVKVGPSPLWLARPLETCGLRSINNVVDVTNYVMLELGIPLHAFDFAAISGGKIVVRFAKKGETLVTLDDRTLELHPEDLVIADAERPIALAGVMGGKNSQVTATTTSVVLECAYFDPATIRRTARRHGIQTDSSYRFERGIDRGRVHISLSRATQLILDVAQASVVRGYHDAHTTMVDDPTIVLSLSHLNHLLGLRLSNAEVADKLTNLGFEIRRSDRESLQVAPPTFRVDMHNEVDLIEEVGRIYGYDKIPETMPGIMVRRGNAGAGVRSRERALRELLTGLGFYEAIHYSFIPDEDAQRHGFDPAAQPRLANPLTVEQAILRPFLLSGLLKTVNLNQRQGADSIRLFEIGKVFSAGARAGHEEDEGFSLALTLAGDEPMNWTAQTGQPRKFDFYDLKGVVEAILREFCGDGEWKIRALEGHGAREYHPGRSAQIMVGDEKIGQFGEMHPAMAAQYDLRGRIYAGEINLAAILKRRGEIARKFEPLPKFPSSERDLALVVDARVPAGDLVDAAMTFGKPLVEELSVIDLYSGSPIPEGKKSLALRFRLRSAEGTLTDEEINALMARIANGLQSSCGATLRA